MVKTVCIYIEGGGDSRIQQKECAEGLRKFLKKAGFSNTMPKITACGARTTALRMFSIAISQGETAFLLVDSEAPVNLVYKQGEFPAWQPWAHLEKNEGKHWQKPEEAADAHCHLMVECMENWLLTDQDALKTFFGKGFNEKMLPAENHAIETIQKLEAFDKLKRASAECLRIYKKGKISFELLAQISPQKVRESSPWADRFILFLTEEVRKIS